MEEQEMKIRELNEKQQQLMIYCLKCMADKRDIEMDI